MPVWMLLSSLLYIMDAFLMLLPNNYKVELFFFLEEMMQKH